MYSSSRWHSPANKHDDVQRSGRIIGHGSVSQSKGLPFASSAASDGPLRSPEGKVKKKRENRQGPFFSFSSRMPYDEVSPQNTACWGQMKTQSAGSADRPSGINQTNKKQDLDLLLGWPHHREPPTTTTNHQHNLQARRHQLIKLLKPTTTTAAATATTTTMIFRIIIIIMIWCLFSCSGSLMLYDVDYTTLGGNIRMCVR